MDSANWKGGKNASNDDNNYYMAVSQGLKTTKFTNLIGWNGYWPWSRFSHLDWHPDRQCFEVKKLQTKMQNNLLFSSKVYSEICKSLACGSWFTNSSRVLPTSRVVHQPINHRYLGRKRLELDSYTSIRNICPLTLKHATVLFCKSHRRNSFFSPNASFYKHKPRRYQQATSKTRAWQLQVCRSNLFYTSGHWLGLEVLFLSNVQYPKKMPLSWLWKFASCE